MLRPFLSAACGWFWLGGVTALEHRKIVRLLTRQSVNLNVCLWVRSPKSTFLTPQLAQRQINSWDFYIRSSVTFTVSNQIVHTPRWVNTYLTIHLPLGILILNSVY